MGQCTNRVEESIYCTKNKEIDTTLKVQFREMKNELKMLLLGAGDTGKSTFAKQMQIIHGSGFSEQERIEYRELIYINVITDIQAIVLFAKKRNIQFEDEVVEAAMHIILKLIPIGRRLSASTQQNIITIMENKDVKDVANDVLKEGSKHLVRNLERIFTDEYMPSDVDILHVQCRTTSVSELHFSLKQGGLSVRLIDVGGQRSERKKWIQQFQDVNAVIFFVAISEYNQVLSENESVNRLKESLDLFDEIVNCKWFESNNCSMILFFNKYDIFKRKIRKIPLENYINEFVCYKDLKTPVQFITEIFLARIRNGKTVHVHNTCAVDTRDIRKVFNDIQQDLLYSFMNSSKVL